MPTSASGSSTTADAAAATPAGAAAVSPRLGTHTAAAVTAVATAAAPTAAAKRSTPGARGWFDRGDCDWGHHCLLLPLPRLQVQG